MDRAPERIFLSRRHKQKGANSNGGITDKPFTMQELRTQDKKSELMLMRRATASV